LKYICVVSELGENPAKNYFCKQIIIADWMKCMNGEYNYYVYYRI
jgi:hypothetical protein